MTCAAEYPLKPCPFDFAGRVTRASCGSCRHFIPPQHILQWCMLWDRDRVLCKLPKSNCPTCPEKAVVRPERIGQIDWRDPSAVRAYFRERYDPDKAKEKMLKFLDKDPEYFKKYQERNRARVNAAAKKWYWKNKAKREAEREQSQQSGGKVP